jgi:excisionase family DNA binding protein
MSKLTFNDLPAAVEALMLRIDILHDLVKKTKDTLDQLVSDVSDPEPTKKQATPDKNIEESLLAPGDEIMDIGLAAKFLGTTNQNLYRAVERHQISHFRKQNHILFKRSDLEKFKKRMEKPSSALSMSPKDEPAIVLGEDDEKLLSMEEATEYTGITRSNLYAYVKTKKVPYVKKGRRLYFPLVALNQLMIASVSGRDRGKRRRKQAESQISQNDNAEKDPDRVTLREIVKILGKHPSTVYYQMRKKNIPVIATKGNRMYFSLKAVQQAFNDQDSAGRKPFIPGIPM